MMTRRDSLLPIAALMMAGCVPASSGIATPSDIIASGEAWFGLGTEPFWNVEITAQRLLFHGMDGERISVANPGARPSFNGERYVTPQLVIDITHVPCSDGMSDRRYADSVRVEANGRSYTGCGGPRVTAPRIDGTGWRITAINGQPLADGREPAELTLREGQLTGTAGCNRMTGQYSIAHDRLSVTGLALTRMACPAALMAQEQAVTALLSGPLAITAAAGGGVTLSREGGGELTLAPWLR